MQPVESTLVFRFACFALLTLPVLPAAAQEVSSTVTGQFGAGDGWHYQAEVYRSAEYLALRVWEGQSPDQLSLVLDNTHFDWTPIGGREWLEVTAEGSLVLHTLSLTEGYLTAGPHDLAAASSR